MLQNSLRYNSMCASPRFSFLGSPSNGPLSFFILTFVAISLPLGLFFLSFYICLILSFSLQISLKRQQTTAFILIESDSLPEPRRPSESTGTSQKLLSWGSQNSLQSRGTFPESQTRGKCLVCPPQVRAQILISTASLVKTFLFNILIKKAVSH